jgi:uncharacterized protein (UPF0332 family)
MIRQLLITLLILITYSDTNAQDKSTMFSKAVDYSNCKLTYAYLNQFTASLPADNAEKKSFDKIKPELDGCEIGNSISYTELSELLNKNNFKYSNQKFSAIIDRIKKTFKESYAKDEAVNKILDGIYSNTELKNVREKNGDIDKLKERLQTDISNYFGDSFGAKQAVIQNTNTDGKGVTATNIESEISRLDKKIDDLAPGIFTPNWLSVIISVLLLIGLIFLLTRITDLTERVDRYREVSKSNSNSNAHTNWNPDTNRNFNSRELSDYKKSIEFQMEGALKAITSLQQEVWRLENRLSQKQENTSLSNQQSTQLDKSQKNDFFYASIPEKDGSFNESAITTSINPTASFYKFTIKDSHSAAFEFINDERAVKDATSSPELILYPVCKIKSALNQGAKNIKTTNPGTVFKRNDKWELGTKAEIQYE